MNIYESIQNNLQEESKFKKLQKSIEKDGKSPEEAAAIAASIGREKYGKKEFQKKAAEGRKKNESMGDFTNTSLTQPANIIVARNFESLEEESNAEVKINGKVNEVLNEVRGKGMDGLEKVLEILNPSANVSIMYNTENGFLHVEVPDVAVIWDGKEPQ